MSLKNTSRVTGPLLVREENGKEVFISNERDEVERDPAIPKVHKGHQVLRVCEDMVTPLVLIGVVDEVRLLDFTVVTEDTDTARGEDKRSKERDEGNQLLEAVHTANRVGELVDRAALLLCAAIADAGCAAATGHAGGRRSRGRDSTVTAKVLVTVAVGATTSTQTGAVADGLVGGGADTSEGLHGDEIGRDKCNRKAEEEVRPVDRIVEDGHEGIEEVDLNKGEDGDGEEVVTHSLEVGDGSFVGAGDVLGDEFDQIVNETTDSNKLNQCGVVYKEEVERDRIRAIHGRRVDTRGEEENREKDGVAMEKPLEVRDFFRSRHKALRNELEN